MRLRWLGALALGALAVGGTFVGQAVTAGPGGWDHLGDAGTPGTKSLNGNVTALHAQPGALYIGGFFTDAAGDPLADKIASWDGAQWHALATPNSQIPENAGYAVFAIAAAGGKVFAGGNFLDAGGNADADYLAVWDDQKWSPFCSSLQPGSAFKAQVNALQIIGSTLYVGGSFLDGGASASADYLLACDLATGASGPTVQNPNEPFRGAVLALAADSAGTLYAGGRFNNLDGNIAMDNIARKPAGGNWTQMGANSGATGCEGCAVDSYVRALTVSGPDLYAGTDSRDVAGIVQADNVVRWNGTAWSAVGANAAGTDGWFPTTTTIYGLTNYNGKVYATGSFQDAGGDPTADNVAVFDGTAWDNVGSSGAGNGP